jgi:(2Fe-2S) ferredoxin
MVCTGPWCGRGAPLDRYEAVADDVVAVGCSRWCVVGPIVAIRDEDGMTVFRAVDPPRAAELCRWLAGTGDRPEPTPW